MKPFAYYNEIDEYAADWLENLIAAGHIAPGVVDRRSIVDVRPADLEGFTQCHFFAGIGVWSAAARAAGWPDDRPLWTGSCPCQPFSVIGKKGGLADERHLWPEFHRLIDVQRPVVVVGEQVASPDGLEWLDVVAADLENSGYACGAIDACAAGFGAPHIRQRMYWLGHHHHHHHPGLQGHAGNGDGGEGWSGAARPASAAGRTSRMANDVLPERSSGKRSARGAGIAVRRIEDSGPAPGRGAADATWRRPLSGFWTDADWLHCRDGNWRPVEPGTLPMAARTAERVDVLRAYGNALVLPQAEAFLRCVASELETVASC
jgi:DNA (cytosine-5)-methyltransferase 1